MRKTKLVPLWAGDILGPAMREALRALGYMGQVRAKTGFRGEWTSALHRLYAGNILGRARRSGQKETGTMFIFDLFYSFVAQILDLLLYFVYLLPFGYYY